MSRWWQLKYLLFLPWTLGKWSNLSFQMCFLTPNLGEDFWFEDHIQGGWFNHQLVLFGGDAWLPKPKHLEKLQRPNRLLGGVPPKGGLVIVRGLSQKIPLILVRNYRCLGDELHFGMVDISCFWFFLRKGFMTSQIGKSWNPKQTTSNMIKRPNAYVWFYAGQTHIGVVKIFVNYPIFVEQTYPALDALLLIPITCDYVFSYPLWSSEICWVLQHSGPQMTISWIF